MLCAAVDGTVTIDPPPTWCSDVAAIVQQHCVRCHQSGGPAPFPLNTYALVSARSAFIGEVVRQGVMPPPLAAAFGDHIDGAAAMTQGQRSVLLAWIHAGLPKGQCIAVALEVDVPAARADLHVSSAGSWPMPAEGGKNWGRRIRDKRSFVLPLQSESPLRIQAMTIRSGVPEAVHAVTLAADTQGRGRWADQREEGEGYRMLGDVGWTPSGSAGGGGIGARTWRLPKGFHLAIEPGADLVAEVHFRPDGRVHALSPSVDLELAEAGPSRPLRTLVSMVRKLDVPIDATETVSDTLVLEHDVDLVAITPRANGVCTALSIEAHRPDGTVVGLVEIDDWDPHWRRPLMLQTPIQLPVGTRLKSSWTIANTKANERNPFVPLEQYSVAMRTGAVAWLLHVAAVDASDDSALVPWGQRQLLKRQRDSRVDSPARPRVDKNKS